MYLGAAEFSKRKLAIPYDACPWAVDNLIVRIAFAQTIFHGQDLAEAF